MSGRTVWLAKDAGWWRRGRIVDLGAEFGPAGPAVIDWLECEAKAQNDGGLVKSSASAIAHGIFTDAVTVGHVLSRAVTLGLLTGFEEGVGHFEAQIAWWKADQERALATTRKARSRAKSDATVTVGHAESQNVTLTGQDRSREEANASSHKPGKPETDQPPDDFPEELLPHLRAVFRVLRGLAERHGAKAVSVPALAQVLMARPHKPLVRAAHDFAGWADGKAQRRKDVVAGYRNWLDRTDDLAAVEPLGDDGRPAAALAAVPVKAGQLTQDRRAEAMRRLMTKEEAA